MEVKLIKETLKKWLIMDDESTEFFNEILDNIIIKPVEEIKIIEKKERKNKILFGPKNLKLVRNS